jgi:hypothetical protein
MQKCAGPPAAAAPATRVYLGSDGVKVPLITDAEKQARRPKVRQKRRPPPRAEPGGFPSTTGSPPGSPYRRTAVTACT